MIVVGLTGGIGSGKSTVTELLARRGAVIVDADAIVHELQRPGAPLLDDLAARFGRDIITADGALDRGKLAALVFGDDRAVRDLNAIVHPAVRAEIARRVASHAGTDNVVVLDIPLLTERRHLRDGRPRRRRRRAGDRHRTTRRQSGAVGGADSGTDGGPALSGRARSHWPIG